MYEQAATIPVNRAFLFGDGIFETMVYADEEIRFWKDHQQRVSMGMRQLKMQPLRDPDIQLVEQLLNNLPLKPIPYRVRWNIFREGLGKYTPETNGHAKWLTVTPFQPVPRIKKEAYFCTSIKVHASPWANCKTLNALPYVMANLERKEKGMDEVILLDENGHLSEAGSSNLFWVKKGVFYTPSLENHCVSGVARKQILQLLKEQGINCQIGSHSPRDLLDADQVFVSNIAGVSYIEKMENRQFDCQPISDIESIFKFA